MFVDILMAFVFALLIECFSWINKGVKPIMILASCVTVVLSYFVDGCQINFAGETDLAVFIVFVIMFDKIIMIGINKLSEYIKE